MKPHPLSTPRAATWPTLFKVRDEPVEIVPETPTLLREVLDLHRNTFGYGLDELSKLLVANPSEIVATYGIGEAKPETRAKLRIVRSEKRA